MRVYEVMSKKVETIRPTAPASVARSRMREREIHHLVVMDGTSIAGVVSDRDLGGAKLSKVSGARSVQEVMTSPVVTVTTRTPVRRAAALMKGRSIGSLIVTSENGKLAGIVTVADLLSLLAKAPETASRRDEAHRSDKTLRSRRRETIREGWER